MRPPAGKASVRAGRVNIREGYVRIERGEAWLLNANIAAWPQSGTYFNHEPMRPRKLLLHRNEIEHLRGKVEQKGLTLVPTRMYFKNGRVKVELALAKGKQLWDKRETERRRTADKEAREAVARGPGGEARAGRRVTE